jgi:predicted dehydrogenase
MALDLTPEQKQAGKENFARAAEGLSRRGFMKSLVAGAAGAALVPATAYMWFNYPRALGKPVKAALIGAGDEGGVLVGEHNPEFLQFIAFADIRPTNHERILKGDPKVPLRKGFRKVYGKNEADAIKPYTDYKAMLDEVKDIEAVVIALPLHLHAAVAVDCMKRGKHVLCEKLMAWNITQCKQMIQAAKDHKRILSIGHQRHYSMLYAHAAEVMQSGILGDVRHIRALWHRNNSWPFSAESIAYEIAHAKDITQPFYRDGWFGAIPKEDYDALEKQIAQLKLNGARQFDSVEQLVRWRLYAETGGGLMAELGGHQLDACSIFLGKVHPLYVSGVGVKSFYRPGHNDRNIDDHVFVHYEFPGKNHPDGPNKGKDKEDVVVISYSSISTNGFEPYGECVMGSHGTMIVESEQSLMLYTEKDPSKKVAGTPKSMTVTVDAKGKGAPVLEAASTWGGPAASPTAAAAGAAPAGTAGPISRGYREEMEDFAYCIREWNDSQGYEKDELGKYRQRLPRCHGEVAMADAIIALTANRAMHGHERIEFKPAWFVLTDEEIKSGKYNVPDADTKPKVPVEKE